MNSAKFRSRVGVVDSLGRQQIVEAPTDYADQLTTGTVTTGTNTYHYDPAGNRLAEITHGTLTSAGQFKNLSTEQVDQQLLQGFHLE